MGTQRRKKALNRQSARGNAQNEGASSSATPTQPQPPPPPPPVIPPNVHVPAARGLSFNPLNPVHGQAMRAAAAELHATRSAEAANQDPRRASSSLALLAYLTAAEKVRRRREDNGRTRWTYKRWTCWLKNGLCWAWKGLGRLPSRVRL